MRAWLKRQLTPIAAPAVRLAVVLDPEGLLDSSDLEGFGEVIEARDWYTLRRAYERGARRRPVEQPRLVILFHSAAHAEPRDLPYDIERQAALIRPRVPVPPEYRSLLLELPDDLAVRTVQVLGPPGYGDLKRLLAELWGVDLGSAPDETRELEAVTRLRLDPTVPGALWPLLQQHLQSPVARSLAFEPPDCAPMQEAWDEYVRRGSESQSAGTIARLGPRLMPLFHVGLLHPSRKGPIELPSWAAAGIAALSAEELAEGLLNSRPQPESPVDLAGWVQQAEWWAHLRAALAELGPDPGGLRRMAWEIWRGLDAGFVDWLRSAYGGLLLSSSAVPISVDRIAGFMAARLRRGEATRIALIVLDGLGLCQWAMVQRHGRFRILQALTCLAMVPTLTPISRQAIFRGALPLYFASTIESTDADSDGWRAFWTDQGLAAREVRYDLILGANPESVPLQPGLTAVAIVIQAIDKMLHGSNVLGDAQLAASVRTWIDRAVLRDLIAEVDRAGYEVWLTSDHGNLETTPRGRALEGLAVDTAGLRVRLYPSPDLRDGSRLREGGISWDPPGLPPGWRYPLFAPGREAYFSGEVRVTHGGLSLDEVIVPLMRVVP